MDERAAFEIAFAGKFSFARFNDDYGNEYADAETCGAWQGWQARASLIGQPPEGWKLVPIEPTESALATIAMALCEADGGDPHTLIWQGQPPEPYGEVWCEYLGEARVAYAAIAAAPQPTVSIMDETQELNVGTR